MNYKKAGQKLKQFRKENKYSLSDVVSACSIDKTYLSRIENGKRRPALDKLMLILNFLDIPFGLQIRILTLYGYPVTTGEISTITSGTWGNNFEYIIK